MAKGEAISRKVGGFIAYFISHIFIGRAGVKGKNMLWVKFFSVCSNEAQSLKPETCGLKLIGTNEK